MGRVAIQRANGCSYYDNHHFIIHMWCVLAGVYAFCVSEIHYAYYKTIFLYTTYNIPTVYIKYMTSVGIPSDASVCVLSLEHRSIQGGSYQTIIIIIVVIIYMRTYQNRNMEKRERERV